MVSSPKAPAHSAFSPPQNTDLLDKDATLLESLQSLSIPCLSELLARMTSSSVRVVTEELFAASNFATLPMVLESLLPGMHVRCAEYLQKHDLMPNLVHRSVNGSFSPQIS